MQLDVLGLERADMQQDRIGLVIVQRQTNVDLPLPLNIPAGSVYPFASPGTPLQRTVSGGSPDNITKSICHSHDNRLLPRHR